MHGPFLFVVSLQFLCKHYDSSHLETWVLLYGVPPSRSYTTASSSSTELCTAQFCKFNIPVFGFTNLKVLSRAGYCTCRFQRKSSKLSSKTSTYKGQYRSYLQTMLAADSIRVGQLQTTRHLTFVPIKELLTRATLIRTRLTYKQMRMPQTVPSGDLLSRTLTRSFFHFH
jgi:hypothetical protein